MMDIAHCESADILRGLTRAELTYTDRDRVFERDREAKSFYIATRGRFSLTVDPRAFDGHTEIAVEDEGPLDAFGWSSLVEPRTSIYSAYCTEDGAVAAFSREELERLMQTNARLGETMSRNPNELLATRCGSRTPLAARTFEAGSPSLRKRPPRFVQWAPSPIDLPCGQVAEPAIRRFAPGSAVPRGHRSGLCSVRA